MIARLSCSMVLNESRIDICPDMVVTPCSDTVERGEYREVSLNVVRGSSKLLLLSRRDSKQKEDGLGKRA